MKSKQVGLLVKVVENGKVNCEEFACEYGDFDLIEKTIGADTCDVVTCRGDEYIKAIMYCDDNGHSKDLVYNNLASYIYKGDVVGNVILFGIDYTSDGMGSRSLTKEEIYIINKLASMINEEIK